tara:strand:+ start:1137 stop:1376 length:240 start_codon:yes stop_codon:yes gene_type:complete
MKRKQILKDMKRKQILKEALTIVFSGLILAYPISLVVIYICIDVLNTSTVLATTINTTILTLVAIIRVFFIRVYTEKNK